MEIELIIGNEEKIIVIDQYYIIDRNAGTQIDQNIPLTWKNDRKSFPRLTMKGGNYIYADENLENLFKVGDQVIFLDLISQQMRSIKK